jgi:DNA-binding MarR family transcriptional regulator
MRKGPHTDSIGYLFIKICKSRRNKANEMLVKHGIHAGQDVLLYYLSLEDGQTVSQLATDIQIQYATISNMINRMVANDLVKKIRDENDARVSRIFLTTKGKDAVIKLREVWQFLEGQTINGLTEDEIRLLKDLLKKVLANF